MRPEKTAVLVVGAGGAGFAAALAAAESGVDVLLLEKTEYPGGSTRMSGGGISAPGTKFQKAAGISDSKAAWLKVWQDRQATSNPNGPYPDYDFVDHYMDEAVVTTEWLADKQGHSYEEPAGFGQDPDRRIHFPKGAPGGMGGGKQLIANLTATVAKRPNITVLTKTRLTDILQEDGRVVGVTVTDEAGTGNIKADKVILATGGFVHNLDMLKKYVPAAQVAGQFAVGGAGDEGDGIELAQKVGAVLYEDPWVIGMGITAALPDTGSLLMDWNKLYVDGSGQRFMNEASHYAVVANKVMETPDPWVIFDSAPANAALIAPFEAAVTAGRAVKADSVAELGQAMGVDSEALVKTISEYNEQGAAGQDKFGKPAENVAPVIQGPFYAARIYPVIMGTFGGVKTNENYEVLDSTGAVIPNLFATGETANKRLYNHVYMSGSAVQFALTSGRVAGQTAAAQLTKK